MSEKVVISPNISHLLKRGVAEVIVEEEMVKLLRSGKRLRLKEGFDPSFPDIHLGHMVALRKLRQFQELGHQVILIVADWTAQIGDPSGMSATRPMLSREQVLANAQTYMEQFFKIVDKDKTETRWQSEWFGKFTLSDIIQLTSKFTVAQLLAREDFSSRYDAGRPIAMTELLYPLLQAYDSVAIQADVEFGGTDQKFNFLVGRELQSMVGQRPQQCFMTPLLVGTDGSQKMSKSLGNYIGVAEPPNEIYGKVMSIPDSLIMDYFELVTDVPDEDLDGFRQGLDHGTVNPMRPKKRLAREIVTQLYDQKTATEAEEHFTRVFQKGEVPEEIPEVHFSFFDFITPLVGNALTNIENKILYYIAQGYSNKQLEAELGISEQATKNHVASILRKLNVSTSVRAVVSKEKPVIMMRGTGDYAIVGNVVVFDISQIIVRTGQAKSRSEANRLIEQGAVEVDGEKVTNYMAPVQSGSIIKVGKRRFAKVINTDTIT